MIAQVSFLEEYVRAENLPVEGSAHMSIPNQKQRRRAQAQYNILIKEDREALRLLEEKNARLYEECLRLTERVKALSDENLALRRTIAQQVRPHGKVPL